MRRIRVRKWEGADLRRQLAALSFQQIEVSNTVVGSGPARVAQSRLEPRFFTTHANPAEPEMRKSAKTDLRKHADLAGCH